MLSLTPFNLCERHEKIEAHYNYRCDREWPRYFFVSSRVYRGKITNKQEQPRDVLIGIRLNIRGRIIQD